MLETHLKPASPSNATQSMALNANNETNLLMHLFCLSLVGHVE